MKILYLATDAYGGRGGIAQYNRDVIEATCRDPGIRRVIAMARVAFDPYSNLPEKLEYHVGRSWSPTRFAVDALKTAFANRDAAIIYCGHINLAPLAWMMSVLLRKPWILTVYGLDVWDHRKSWLRRFFAMRATRVISISDVTLRRLRAWCPIPPERAVIVPNAVHLQDFGLGAKPAYLLKRYGLEGCRTVMTLGRLESFERHKGFDAMLETLPRLVRHMPDLRYLIVGDGRDMDRLKSKANTLGLCAHVIFTGQIAESEKADHYRLADSFVLASKGEGFGFVLLEAMACGIPVIASTRDGSYEAVLGGKLGTVVDPDNSAELAAAVRASLASPKAVPEGLKHFAFANFAARLRAAVRDVVPQAALDASRKRRADGKRDQHAHQAA